MQPITIPLKLNLECIPLKLNWIPPGRFIMGDKEGLSFDELVDSPMGQFEVIISKGYWIGVYPVTQCQWQTVMGTNPSRFRGANLPAEMMSWEEAMDFCQRLDTSQLAIPEGYRFSLPTEAQWEYACRAGTIYNYQVGDSVEDLSRVAWHRSNLLAISTPVVGQKEPNNWGLHDMLGTVSEWCFDCPIDYPDGTTQVDWVAKTGFANDAHILRGGCAFMETDNPMLRCGGRAYGYDGNWFFGFRLCLRYMEN